MVFMLMQRTRLSILCVRVCVRLRGDDGVLLVCERCDKAYHTHCLTPPLDHTLSTGWSCKVRDTHTHIHWCQSQCWTFLMYICVFLTHLSSRTAESVGAVVWGHQASGPITRFCASHVTLPCPALSVTMPPTSTHHRNIWLVSAAIGTHTPNTRYCKAGRVAVTSSSLNTQYEPSTTGGLSIKTKE